MNNERIEKVVEDSCNESNAQGLRSIARDFYSRELRSCAVLAWIMAVTFIGLAVYSAVHFFQAADAKWQIIYAVLFIVAVHELGMIRVFAWQMAHRHNLKRDIKRLELRVAELSETASSRR